MDKILFITGIGVWLSSLPALSGSDAKEPVLCWVAGAIGMLPGWAYCIYLITKQTT